MSKMKLPLVAIAIAIALAVWLAACAQSPTPDLIGWKPGAIDDAPLDATIELSFDQPMDADSVVAAFHITPTVKGTFSALYREVSAPPRSPFTFLSPLPTSTPGGPPLTVITFKPDKPLDKATRYHIALDASARATGGQTLSKPFTAAFTTTGQLSVDSYPASGAVNVATGAAIRVSFNVPISPTDKTVLAFTPPVEGEGRWWEDKRNYEFQPKSLKPATRYTVRVLAGIAAPTGEKLLRDAVITFTTIQPAVNNYAPTGYIVRPSESVTLTFNLPMDKATVESRFALRRADGQTVQGRFAWQDNQAMVFTPQTQLSEGATYSVTLRAGARATTGDAPLERDFVYTFRVAPLPELTRSTPADGDMKAYHENRVTLSFNVPMDTAAVEKALRISPEPAEGTLYLMWNAAADRLEIQFEVDPSTLYSIVLDDNAVDFIGRRLRGNRSIVFHTAPLNPDVWLVGPRGYWSNVYGTYNPNPQVRQYTQFRNVEKLTYRLSSVTREDFLANWRPDWYEDTRRPRSTPILTWTQMVSTPLNKWGYASTQITLPDGAPLPSGVYLLEVSGSPGYAKDWRVLIVSPLNLALKRSNHQTFVWATDLRTGQPVANLPLTVYDQNKKVIATGVTNEVGVFKTTEAARCSDWWECAYGWLPLYIVAEGQAGGEGLWAFVSSTWDQGITTQDFQLPYYYGEPSHTAFLYSDRPIYRPAQTVYFKGIVRRDSDGRYSLPAFNRIPVVIIDAQGNEIYKEELPLTDMGTFYGEIKLGSEAALGMYTIQARYAEDEQPAAGNFRVAEYRKPEFKVQVTPNTTAPVHGEIVTVTVQADYYFGAPLAGATVEWRMVSDDYYFELPDDWYTFGDWSEAYWLWGEELRSEQLYASGSGTTDARGLFTFTIPIDLAKARRSQVLTFEADVTDQNHQVTSARGYAVAHKGQLYVGARMGSYVSRPGEPLSIQLVAASADKSPLPNLPLSVELYERTWYSVRIRDAYGVYRWQSNYTDKLISTQTVTTTANGRAVAMVTPPRGGEYKVVARGWDAREVEAVASTYFWTWGGEYINWGIQNDDRLNVIADKRSYKPGETAHLLITAPFADSTALVSVERGGVLRYWTLPVKGTSALLDVPIHADYAPNVFVSVILLKSQAQDFPAADFKIGYAALNVELTQQQLNIALIPDRARYAPRDTAAFTVRVTDYLGRPVDAEVSLSLIDAAVLALVGDQDRDILTAFYRQRGLGVHNSLTLVASVDRFTVYLDKKAKGGGGGGQVLTRELFADTAYWRAAVRTGPGGETTVYIPLPDNLTTWRMRAKAVTADTKLGQGEVDVTVTQDILVRPVLPRFFTMGDQAHIGAIVHNYTPVTQTMKVSLSIAGQADNPSHQATIGPNGSAPVYWDITVPRTFSITLYMQALTPDGRGDAVRLTLPVNAFFESLPYASYQPVTSTATIRVTLPPDVDRTLDELVIEVEPSLAASIDSGLEYLVGFPYGCVEQTMSRFLPDVVVMRMLKELGVEVRPGFHQKVDEMITAGLQRLYDFQHNDGGWGWWKNDNSNPAMTAYVLYGLHQMERGGRPIDAKVRDNAADYLLHWLKQSPSDETARWFNTRAYALYVLAELGQGDPGLNGRLYEQRQDLDYYGQAYLALAMYLTNGNKRDARVDALLQDLRDAAKRAGSYVYWEDKKRDDWGMSTRTRTTAIVIHAFARLATDDPLVDPALRWLLMQRREGHWSSTQETSLSLVAITEYLVTTFERQANYTCTIHINGREIAAIAVTPETLGKGGKWIAPLQNLEAGDPLVQITRSAGPGAPVHVNVSLRHYRAGEDIKPLYGQSVYVERNYATAGKSLAQLAVGDIVTVTLKVQFSQEANYVVVEDMLPAGLEPIDTSLATTSQQYRGNQRDWVWSYVELRDDRVALFATWLPNDRTYTYTYLARATTSGAFYALPMQAYAMYRPDIIGRTSGEVIKIRSK